MSTAREKIMMKKVGDLLGVIGELQTLIGRAQGAYLDDRAPDRAERVMKPLQEAFNLCIDTLDKFDYVEYTANRTLLRRCSDGKIFEAPVKIKDRIRLIKLTEIGTNNEIITEESDELKDWLLTPEGMTWDMDYIEDEIEREIK